MDLVDIDKLLDEFESSEQTSSSTDKRIQSSDTNRRIKVRSVLSSLNDYVDYDRKQNDKSATAPPVPECPEDPQKNAPNPCEQTAVASVAVVDVNNYDNNLIAGGRDSNVIIIDNRSSDTNNEEPAVEEEKEQSVVVLATVPVAEPSNPPPNPEVDDSPTLTTTESVTKTVITETIVASTVTIESTGNTPPVVISESHLTTENHRELETHVTESSAEAATTSNNSTIAIDKQNVLADCDPEQIVINSTSEEVVVIPSDVKFSTAVTTPSVVEIEEQEDEDDLEKYLDNLVEEYDKSLTVKSSEEENIDKDDTEEPKYSSPVPSEDQPPPVPAREDLIPQLQEDKESQVSSRDITIKSVDSSSKPLIMESQVMEVPKVKEIKSKSQSPPKGTKEETPSPTVTPPIDNNNQNEDPVKPPEEVLDPPPEMNLDEIRELEKLIQQQERDEQMELDRQMALQLQEGDDAELVQSMTGGTVPEVEPSLITPPQSPPSPSTTNSLHPIPSSSSSSTAPGLSPLEAPRSTSVVHNIMEDDPEYRYLMSLGKTAPYWVPDTTHDSCMQCDQKFSLLKRRHHCRCCGELLCATCCSFRALLEYMRDQQQLLSNASTSSNSSSSSSGVMTSGGPAEWPEARICTKCDKLVQRRDELLQLRYLAECGIGEDSGLAEFPIKGVLKKPKVVKGEGSTETEDQENNEDEDTTTDNSDSTATPTKAVIFSDGIRPGHDDFSGEGQRSRRGRGKGKVAVASEATTVVAVQSPSESEVVARALNSYKAFVTALKTYYNLQSQSYLPPIKTHLPPMLKNYGGFLPAVELKNDFGTCQELCEFLKADRRDFLVQKRLHCAVRIVDYRVDANQLDNQCRWCLNVTTNGMSLLGQQEFVILIEMNAEYLTTNASSVDDIRNLKFLLLLLRRLFLHFNKIYTRIYSELQEELKAKRKMEVAQLQHPDPSFLLLDNRVLVAPFHYFNKAYVPLLGPAATTPANSTGKSPDLDSLSSSSNGNDSDESENSYICDKYTFLKAKNKFIQHMDLQKITLGTKGDPDFYLDFNAVLYVRASLQSTHNVILPDSVKSCGGQQVLFGLFVKHTEIPWAKLFPLRLLLRMGAEYRLYPWPLFNALDRKCLYSEFVDNSIIHFLADFRNFSFTLNEIPGLHMHMEHDKVIPSLPDAVKEDNVRVSIYLPKINYKRIEAMINDSSESILSFMGSLNPKADGHLVCIQQQSGQDGSKSSSGSGSVAYSTQSLNIDQGAGGEGEAGENNGRASKTGLNFFILNGALKSATGLKAKMSIIEDGVMVQVLPTIMSQVRNALLEMKDFEVKCEESGEKGATTAGDKKQGPSEVINFVWTSATGIETIIGLKSEIDEKSLEHCSYVNMLCDYHKRTDASKTGQSGSSSRGMFGLRSSNARLEMDCFYLHLHRVVLLEEENYFGLFNEKMVRGHVATQEEGNDDVTDENANLIKSLNVTNWEVPSINFLIKLSALLGRIVDRALSRHYSKLYAERLREIGVRFQFDRDQIVTYEAGSCGTKLPMAFMNDLDNHLIPMLHHILELRDVPNNVRSGLGLSGLGHNLNAEFLDRINLLQNLQRSITFELVFNIVVDLP